MKNPVLDGIMGLCVGDALGVPVEFMSREELEEEPVVDMRSYGTYNQPAGTWSDDTSMTLGLLDSLSKGLDYDDIMKNFIRWFEGGDYTPFGQVFDVGIATRKALTRYLEGVPALECGGKSEYDNGNGSLMRILPTVFYLESIYGEDLEDGAFEIVGHLSSLTHAHRRSQIGCGIYISIAYMILRDMDLKTAIDLGILKAVEYYRRQDGFKEEVELYRRLEGKDFDKTPRDEISSSGYVVSSLEASIWSLMTTSNYRDCVLKAVNLGKDTDTVAAIAGGLAGLYYGYEDIPKEWVEKIVRRDYIEKLCENLMMAYGQAFKYE